MKGWCIKMTLKMKVNDQYQSEEVMNEYLNSVMETFNENEKELFMNVLDNVFKNDGEMTVEFRIADDGSGDYYVTFHRVIPPYKDNEET